VIDKSFSTDPMEIVMLEQLHRLAQMHVRDTEVTSPDLVKIINTAVTDLMGEFRGLSLPIRIYSKPPSRKSRNVVHRQNLVTGGDGRKVHYVDGSTSEQEKVSFGVRSNHFLVIENKEPDMAAESTAAGQPRTPPVAAGAGPYLGMCN
jgi:hypothetical protein